MNKRKLHFLIIIITIYLCVGCQTDVTIKNKAVDFLWEYANEHPEGFTLNIQTYQEITQGIAVSYFETQNSFGKEKLSSVVTHALEHESIVGGWFNDSTSLYYFDSDKIFPDTALSEAIEFAIKNKQYAIYDISKDSLIWLSDSLK